MSMGEKLVKIFKRKLRVGLLQHLPNGGKPPATDDEEGLLILLDSTLDKESVSATLLPVPLPWDKFC